MKCVTCTRCRWKKPVGVPVKRCPECAGLTEFEYDLTQARVVDSENPLERYFDLLPLTDRSHMRWCGDGNTRTIDAKELARAIDMESVWVKVEGDNPSGSTKDRAFSVVLSYLAQCGVREFGMCSTGNSSTACGRAAQLFPAEVRAHVFIGKDFLPRLNFPDSDNVFVYLVEGDFVGTDAVALEYCTSRGIHWEGGFFNPARRAGHKLAFLEALDAMDREPAWVFQAVSSGMGVLGARQGFLDYLGMGKLQRMPRLVGVQQERCRPMVKAWEEGMMTIQPHHILQNPTGLAKALLRGNPTKTYPFFRQTIESTNGLLCAVSDTEIVEARWLVFTCEGLEICHASAIGLAGMIKLRRRGVVERGQPVLVNLTGRDRSDTTTPKRYQVLPGISASAPAADQSHVSMKS